MVHNYEVGGSGVGGEGLRKFKISVMLEKYNSIYFPFLFYLLENCNPNKRAGDVVLALATGAAGLHRTWQPRVGGHGRVLSIFECILLSFLPYVN
jgi:hypothetical protein